VSVRRCVDQNGHETDLPVCNTAFGDMRPRCRCSGSERSHRSADLPTASRNASVTQLGESERAAQRNGRRNSEIGKLMKFGCLIGVLSHGTKGRPPGSNVPSLSAGIRFRAIADVGLYRLQSLLLASAEGLAVVRKVLPGARSIWRDAVLHIGVCRD
jgi:hypothetical protein